MCIRDRIDSWWDSAYASADEKEKERIDRSRMQWEAVKLIMHPNQEDGSKFYDKMKKYAVRWNEWRELKDAPDFKLPPTEWLK